MSVNNNYDQNVQKALDDMAQRYKDVETWIAEIETKNKDIQTQSKNLQNHHGWWIFTWVTVNHDATNAISADKAAISALADKIASVDADGGSSPFAALADAIKDCMSADFGGGIGDNGSNQGNYTADLSAISTTLTALVKALNEKVIVEEDEGAISLLNQNPDGANSSDVSALIQKVIGDEGEESSTLESLTSNLDDALKCYQAQYNAASNDEDNIHWYDYLLDGDPRHRTDEANKTSATNMMSFIQAIRADFTPELACLVPDLQQVSSMIDQILKKLTDILNANLSPTEKSQEIMKLNGEIMELFVVVIGLLSLVQQNATKEKTKNEAVMSKATSLASEMGVANNQAQIVKITQDMAYAKTMKILMEVAKYALEAICALAAPGIGSMLVAVLMIVLDATGALDLLTNAIEKAIQNCHTLTPEQSKIVADVLVGVMEMAVTMGGGAILDALLKNVMENVMKVVATELTQVVKQATEEATEAVSKAIDETASKMVAPTLKIAAEKAAEQAAKKVFVASFERNGLKLALEWVKEAATGGYGAAERMVEKTMITAAKDAAERAVQDAAKIISIAGKVEGVTADQITKQITKVAIEAGNAAAADAMGMSLKDIAKVMVREGTLDAVRVAAKRGFFTALYAVGSTNILVDGLQAYRKEHPMDNTEYEILLGIAEALQAILALIGQMGGSGVAAQFMNGVKGAGAFVPLVMKITNVLAPIATAAEAGASFAQYQIDMNMADASSAMAKTQTVLDVLMKFLSQQIDSRRKQEAKHDNAEFEEQMKSNFSVASHLCDYLNTSSQVMLQG